MNEHKTPISSAVSDEESALNRLGIKTYHRRTIRTGIFLEREERMAFRCGQNYTDNKNMLKT